MTDADAPPDGELVAYVESIEDSIRAQRGKDHPLSPRDFALAKSWHEADRKSVV